ncbi:MAG: hypothetical protein J7L14_03120 [Candidatus Diapherotrites archaeon]|nr:hypothetical protein [Candidatus Diapherotrites archaeon]
MRKLLIEENDKWYIISAEEIKRPEKLKAIADNESFKIIKLLTERSLSAQQIAKETSIGLQKVYYILKKMEKQKLIKVKSTEEKRGALLKYYTATLQNILVRLAEHKQREYEAKSLNLSAEARNFLEPFIHNEILNATIIVGSPDPHGKLKARARDADIAAELGFFLGLYANNYSGDVSSLDTEMPDLEELNSNLIVLGGPITNRIALQTNKYTKLQFKFKGGKWIIESKLSGKAYDEDNIGIIEKLRHPYFKDRYILLIAGRRNIATRACIFALMNYLEEIAKGNKYNRKIKARIIEGTDKDADGKIDSIEFLE